MNQLQNLSEFMRWLIKGGEEKQSVLRMCWGGGVNSHMKGAGMVIISLRSANHRFSMKFQDAMPIFLAVKISFRVGRKKKVSHCFGVLS